MPADEKRDLPLEIGHVLFIDIVGYSKLLINEQTELLEHLKEMVRGSEQVRAADAEGKLIRLATGDGMALVFRNSPEAPAQCALEVSRADKEHPELQLRMGIHSGPIHEVTDVNERMNVTGAGINTAQRVMDYGDAGHILLSKRAADDLAQYRHWQPLLHDLGEVEVKHGVRIGLVNLHTNDLGNPAQPSKLQAHKAESPVAPRRVGTLWLWPAIIGLILLSLGGALWWFAFRPAHPLPSANPPALESAIPEKSIAVLPLENLSDDKDNAFFADGIQDDVLSSLAKIKELKVISRSSVMSYRDTAQRNLREIGQQLGVANLLEGSVRRVGNRVLVNVALIDTRNERQIWAERYDRTLADALSLQGELATEIATALRATLSPEEKARLEAQPTENADAYMLYLRGREYENRPTYIVQNYQTAEHLYTRALALDPTFALAHARLSITLAYIYLNFQPKAEIKARARAEAEEALRLRPDGGEGHLARALCLYWTERDYEGGLRELQACGRLLPNNPEVDFYTAAIYRRQGRWNDALAKFDHAIALDPRNAPFVRELLNTYAMLRDWTAAGRMGERAVQLAPDIPTLRVENSYVALWSKGDLGPLRATLAEIPRGVDPDGKVTLARWDAALLARDFAAAEREVETAGADTVLMPFGATPLPKSYLLGCIALARGDSTRAQPLFEAARIDMEAEVSNFPLDAFRHAQLGLLYGYLGRKEDALREGRRGVELLPESLDAYFGPNVSAYLALIYARSGEPDQALELIERLLVTAGPSTRVFEPSITFQELRLRWQWDPLRGNPRFQKLLQGLEPKTVYR